MFFKKYKNALIFFSIISSTNTFLCYANQTSTNEEFNDVSELIRNYPHIHENIAQYLTPVENDYFINSFKIYPEYIQESKTLYFHNKDGIIIAQLEEAYNKRLEIEENSRYSFKELHIDFDSPTPIKDIDLNKVSELISDFIKINHTKHMKLVIHNPTLENKGISFIKNNLRQIETTAKEKIDAKELIYFSIEKRLYPENHYNEAQDIFIYSCFNWPNFS